MNPFERLSEQRLALAESIIKTPWSLLSGKELQDFVTQIAPALIAEIRRLWRREKDKDPAGVKDREHLREALTATTRAWQGVTIELLNDLQSQLDEARTLVTKRIEADAAHLQG
jgi:hypothetical protein